MLALGACKRTDDAAAAGRHAGSTRAGRGEADRAVGADDNLNAVLWMQASAEYRRRDRRPIYRAAADKLDAALKEKNWDALVPDERGNAATGLTPAVVMDVDETVLDNSPYQARLMRDGKEYDEVTWDAVGRREEGQAGAGRGRVRQGRRRQGRDDPVPVQPRRAPEGRDHRQPQGGGHAGEGRQRVPRPGHRSSKAASRTAARRTAAAGSPGRNTAC